MGEEQGWDGVTGMTSLTGACSEVKEGDPGVGLVQVPPIQCDPAIKSVGVWGRGVLEVKVGLE